MKTIIILSGTVALLIGRTYELNLSDILGKIRQCNGHNLVASFSKNIQYIEFTSTKHGCVFENFYDIFGAILSPISAWSQI